MTSVHAPTDLDLATRCALGDRAAQHQLFDSHVDYVHAILFRILGRNHDIEDLVQDTFIEVFRSLENFRGEAQLRTWIARITTRVAFAYLSRRRMVSVNLEAIPELGNNDASAEERIIVREAGRRLYALLDELDAKHRIAFTLHVIDGVPLREVATMMSSSVVATKSRIWRARRQVREDPVVAAFLDDDSAGPDIVPFKEVER